MYVASVHLTVFIINAMPPDIVLPVSYLFEVAIYANFFFSDLSGTVNLPWRSRCITYLSFFTLELLLYHVEFSYLKPRGFFLFVLLPLSMCMSHNRDMR